MEDSNDYEIITNYLTPITCPRCGEVFAVKFEKIKCCINCVYCGYLNEYCEFPDLFTEEDSIEMKKELVQFEY